MKWPNIKEMLKWAGSVNHRHNIRILCLWCEWLHVQWLLNRKETAHIWSNRNLIAFHPQLGKCTLPRTVLSFICWEAKMWQFQSYGDINDSSSSARQDRSSVPASLFTEVISVKQRGILGQINRLTSEEVTAQGVLHLHELMSVKLYIIINIIIIISGLESNLEVERRVN